MAYRLANIRGFELVLNLDDRARSSSLWQYCLKPAAHTLGRAAAAAGALASLTGSSKPAPQAAARQVTQAPTPEQQRILDRIKGIEWYHTIDLGNGIQTPGRFNHIPLLRDYLLPERLDGMRALDVATMNGFWAFELERRGAREVVALDVANLGDLDLPPIQRARMTSAELAVSGGGGGFVAAREILNSKVERRTMTVYDLSPETAGKFDFVFVGDLLLHLMNPIQAAANICQVTSSVAHVVDCFSPYLPKMTMQYLGAEQATWWGISLSALERILWDAGFKKVELLHKFKAPSQPGQPAWMWRAVFRCTN
ncbi:MAG TPA: methyltransferase domain-containing protein [Bryobacteraceae bacterium]|nr:methyltransferase domain-containing protein [Bryobacteraceae bacterium]